MASASANYARDERLASAGAELDADRGGGRRRGGAGGGRRRGVRVCHAGHGGCAPAAIAVIALTLLGAAVAALAAAVLPGRDPLALQRARPDHVRLCRRDRPRAGVHSRSRDDALAVHRFLPGYWPLIVMAIAFVGVGFAEFCRRRKLAVLAEPVENTGDCCPCCRWPPSGQPTRRSTTRCCWCWSGFCTAACRSRGDRLALACWRHWRPTAGSGFSSIGRKDTVSSRIRRCG